jgi:hypothetical protein
MIVLMSCEGPFDGIMELTEQRIREISARRTRRALEEAAHDPRGGYLSYVAAVLLREFPVLEEVEAPALMRLFQRSSPIGDAVKYAERRMRPLLATLKRPSALQHRSRAASCFFGSVKVDGRNAP